MNHFSAPPRITRSKFIKILSNELLKTQNDCIYEQLPHIDIEQIYQHYLSQNISTEEFAIRFVNQLINLCATYPDIAYIKLILEMQVDSNR